MSSGIEAGVPVRKRRAVSGWAKGRWGRSVPAPAAVAGFTLIELMIALLIVGIITAVAIPSYRYSVIKANRRAAQSTMMDIAQREQQYLLDQRSYSPFSYSGCAGTNSLNYTPPNNVCQNYSLVVTAVATDTPPDFTITATPVPGSMQDSDGTLSLTNTGTKTPSNLW